MSDVRDPKTGRSVLCNDFDQIVFRSIDRNGEDGKILMWEVGNFSCSDPLTLGLRGLWGLGSL